MLLLIEYQRFRDLGTQNLLRIHPARRCPPKMLFVMSLSICRRFLNIAAADIAQLLVVVAPDVVCIVVVAVPLAVVVKAAPAVVVVGVAVFVVDCCRYCYR